MPSVLNDDLPRKTAIERADGDGDQTGGHIARQAEAPDQPPEDEQQR